MTEKRLQNAALSTSYRWEVAARLLLAFVGGFALISALGALCVAFMTKAGWMPRAQAVHILTLLSFAAWCGIAMWVFFHKRLLELTFLILLSTSAVLGVFLLVR